MPGINFLLFITGTSSGFLWRGSTVDDSFILSERRRFGEITAERDAIVISFSDYEIMCSEGRTFPERIVYVMVNSDNQPEYSDDFHFVSSFEELCGDLLRLRKNPSVTVTSSSDSEFLEMFLPYAHTVCITTVNAFSAVQIPCPALERDQWVLIEELPTGTQSPGDVYTTTYSVYERTTPQQALPLAC